LPRFSPFPDIEALVGTAIRDSGVVSGGVFSSVPTKPVYPLAVVKRLGGIPAERHRLDAARIQVEVHGDNKGQAYDAADAARIECMELEGTTSSEWAAVVTGVDMELGVTYLPDPDTGRDRYLFAVVVYAHELDA
jgi:hypothetical protein